MENKDLKIFTGNDNWTFGGNEELAIAKIVTADGPNGLRKVEDNSQIISSQHTIRSTCFPCASTLACSFNVDLEYSIGKSIGEECSFNHVDLLLGPSINIKRSPLGGRNFEYFSEDPYLTAKMGSAFVNGLQSTGTGSVVKHFAVNSQEYARMINDSIIDDRALREIYLSAFEEIIKTSNPMGIMTSYNKINGVYASENKYLLTDILRNEWKFNGVVISDWGAVDNLPNSLLAGLDIEMPNSSDFFLEDLNKANEDGLLEECGPKTIKRLQELSKRVNHSYLDKYDQQAHNDLIKVAILESAVLLKNDNNLLPLKKEEKILVIGQLFEHARIQGGGSSHIHPTSVATPKIVFDKQKINYDYLPGYLLKSKYTDKSMTRQVMKVASNYDKIIVFIGLNDLQEFEGIDRENLSLPANQLQLIDELSYYYENIILIINDSSVIEMPFAKDVGAILKVHLLGQTGAYAIPELLYGEVSPSGRLAETYPISLSDTPSYYDYGNNPRISLYLESVYVGYRYYERAKKEVLYPFGYGLSYTEFKYSDMQVKKQKDGSYEVQVCVENIGNYDASEVVQIYISPKSSAIYRPIKELKGFKKIFIKKNSSHIVSINLNSRAFSFYDIDSKSFEIERGQYRIICGKSAIEDIIETEIFLEGKEYKTRIEEIPSYYNLSMFSAEDFEKVLGHKIETPTVSKPFNFSSSIKELSSSMAAKFLINLIKSKYLEKLTADQNIKAMMSSSFIHMPIRSFVMLSNGKFTKHRALELLRISNGDIIDGLIGFIKNKPQNIDEPKVK